MRSVDNKLYVNIKTGVVYHKPAKVNGIPYEPAENFYEITEEQAVRIDSGEALREVLRDGLRQKVESQLSKDLPETAEAAETAETAETVEATDGLDSLKTHADVDAFAVENGIEIPEDLTTILAK